MAIDYSEISGIFKAASGEGRNFLYEYEVYQLLSRSGAETPPATYFIGRGAMPSDETLLALPGEKSVLKIVSPAIIHKTEVGGVRVVDKEPGKIRSAVRRMLYEVPEQFGLLIERDSEAAPEEYAGLRGETLTAAIRRDIKGVLQVQFMPPDSEAFGNELIVGLRRTREFGMVISAGLGGTDTELYGERFRKGQAIVAASTLMQDGCSFFELFKQTIAYRKLAGLTRGQRRIVTDEQLIECFESFISMANFYSPLNTEAPFVIDELEINPFAFTDYLMVPLDGMCRFSLAGEQPATRPVKRIDKLLHPERIGIIGVSAKRRNFGRIILDNIIAEGFPPEQVVILRDGVDSIGGSPCVPDLQSVEGELDLFIVAVGADQVPGLVDEILASGQIGSVMLIPGGMGETEDSRERAEQVAERIREKHRQPGQGPVFLGANCMGVISRPGRYDTWFIPEEKLPRQHSIPSHRAALISQSGAFMLHRSHQFPELRPAYMISMGNQTDLSLGDMVSYFKDSDKVDVIAVYAEGFNDLDGLTFIRAVRQAVLAGKEVIFYKAGRTAQGKAATSGHTASLAGDYMVCENCVRQAGAIVARNFTEFQELFFLAETLNGTRIHGNRLAAVSGAGFEAVGMADSIESDDFSMQLAEFSAQSTSSIAQVLKEKRLSSLVTIANPLDINPAADDEAHVKITEVLLADPNVDGVVLSLGPMSPAMHTLPGEVSGEYDLDAVGGVKNLLTELIGRSSKPVVTVVDGGRLYDELRDGLMAASIPVFTVCDRAVAALALYIQGRLAADAIRAENGRGGTISG